MFTVVSTEYGEGDDDEDGDDLGLIPKAALEAVAPDLSVRPLTGGRLKFIVFDLVFCEGKPFWNKACSDRFQKLELLLKTKPASRLVGITSNSSVKNRDELRQLVVQSVEGKWEGLVLKYPLAPYHFGVTKFVAKLKLPGPDINCVVIGAGHTMSKNPRIAGLLVVSITYALSHAV